MTVPSSQVPARIAQPGGTDAYQARTEANAAATAAQVAAIIAAWRAWRVEVPELRTYLSTAIRAGAARAVSLADLALTDHLAAVIGRPVPVVGLVLPDETARVIRAGVDTILDDAEPTDDVSTDDVPDESAEGEPTDAPGEVERRVLRLAGAAPLDAGQDAHQEAMRRQGVEGWTRQTDADPCPLCIELADGKVIGIDRKMIRHPSCSCVAVPVLTGAEPFQSPEDGPDDPAEFVPTTLRTGQGIGGREYTRVRPGLVVSRSVFIPARVKDE